MRWVSDRRAAHGRGSKAAAAHWPAAHGPRSEGGTAAGSTAHRVLAATAHSERWRRASEHSRQRTGRDWHPERAVAGEL